MKLVTIPFSTREASRLVDRQMRSRGKHIAWWRKEEKDIPHQGLLARSTGNGVIVKDAVVFLIDGHNREVFPNGSDKFVIHEYVGLVEGTGWQPLVQLGRDVDLV